MFNVGDMVSVVKLTTQPHVKNLQAYNSHVGLVGIVVEIKRSNKDGGLYANRVRFLRDGWIGIFHDNELTLKAKK